MLQLPSKQLNLLKGLSRNKKKCRLNFISSSFLLLHVCQAVQLESVSAVRVRYLMIVSTLASKQESVLLGMDFPNSERCVWPDLLQRCAVTKKAPDWVSVQWIIFNHSAFILGLCFTRLQRSVHHRTGPAGVERHAGLPGWRWVNNE